MRAMLGRELTYAIVTTALRVGITEGTAPMLLLCPDRTSRLFLVPHSELVHQVGYRDL